MSASVEKARAVKAERHNRRLTECGEMVSLGIMIPRKHLDMIADAALLDHRTASNFIYHAAVQAAQRVMQEASR